MVRPERKSRGGILRRLWGWLGRRGPVFRWVPVDRIQENPKNVRDPRREEGYEALRDSIARIGIVVPVLVTRQGRWFRLVAGHRRLRAARELGLARVPAIVRSLDRSQVLEVALAENQHRVGLNALEVARALDWAVARQPRMDPRRLAQQLGLPWDGVEEGRALARISSTLREAVLGGRIDAERARILDEVEDAELQGELLEMVAAEGLDVEETRAVVDRVLQREPSFVTARDARHFHTRECPFAQAIPQERRVGLYSKREGRRYGKLACMNCL